MKAWREYIPEMARLRKKMKIKHELKKLKCNKSIYKSLEEK